MSICFTHLLKWIGIKELTPTAQTKNENIMNYCIIAFLPIEMNKTIFIAQKKKSRFGCERSRVRIPVRPIVLWTREAHVDRAVGPNVFVEKNVFISEENKFPHRELNPGRLGESQES